MMLEWFGRRQTIALPINSVVGCLIATILLMILSENNENHQQNGRAQPGSRAVLAMSDDRPASVADIVVEELRKKEINGPIRLPKRDFFTRGQKLKVKDPWHILSGYDLEFAGMSTRERVRVMLEWFGRRQTIALPINSVVGCLIATILLMILSENNVRTQALRLPAWWGREQLKGLTTLLAERHARHLAGRAQTLQDDRKLGEHKLCKTPACTTQLRSLAS